MKKISRYLAISLSCFSAIIFVSFLAFRFPSPAYAALDTGYPCQNSPECVKYTQDSKAYCSAGHCIVPVGLLPPSSLEKFQTIVQKAEEKGETNLQWYLGSDNGTMEGITNSLTGLIVGNNIDWEQLHAGNFQNARIGGAYGFTANLVAQVLTQPPVSSREYFADLGKNFGIIKPAYAQAGVGFPGLSNLLPLWKATRNLAYILFVIIFLITGLAIMFRVKLDPKTVVTIQNAIPKLIIALILITFSYAIVGLLIDLIYVIIYLGVLALAGPIQMVNHSATAIADTQSKFTSLSFGSGIETILADFVAIITSKGTILPSTFVGGLLGGLAIVLADVVSLHTSIIIGSLAVLIFAVIPLYLIIKLFFSLLWCYISIILSVIFAPLQIMLGALPGGTSGFSSWFKNLLANILVFPAVSLLLLIGQILAQVGGPDWTPPVMGVSGGGLTAILSLGILLVVNKAPNMVKAAFKMAKPVDYGAAIAEPFQAAYRVGLAGYKAVQEHYPPAVQMRAKREGEYKAIVEKYQREKEGK